MRYLIRLHMSCTRVAAPGVCKIVGKQHAQITAAARERCRRLPAHLAHQQTLQYTQMVCMHMCSLRCCGFRA